MSFLIWGYADPSRLNVEPTDVRHHVPYKRQHGRMVGKRLSRKVRLLISRLLTEALRPTPFVQNSPT